MYKIRDTNKAAFPGNDLSGPSSSTVLTVIIVLNRIDFNYYVTVFFTIKSSLTYFFLVQMINDLSYIYKIIILK